MTDQKLQLGFLDDGGLLSESHQANKEIPNSTSIPATQSLSNQSLISTQFREGGPEVRERVTHPNLQRKPLTSEISDDVDAKIVHSRGDYVGTQELSQDPISWLA